MPKGIPNPAAMYGIYTKPWGYEVSIVRSGNRFIKQFGKSSYGGADQALLEAQAWRDFVVRSVPPVARRTRAERLKANNTTGVAGVTCHLDSNGKIKSWLAKTYVGEDEVLRTHFPVDAWGNAALTLAIEERQRQLEHMQGLARLHPAEEAIRIGMIRTRDDGPRAAKRSKSEIVRTTNTSGVSGVHFKCPNAGHPGYWLAITYTAGKGTVSKAFSIKEHGNDMAKSLAIAERAEQLARKLHAEDAASDVATTAPQDPQKQPSQLQADAAQGHRRDH